MSRLTSPLSGRTMETNVKADQLIHKNEEVLVIDEEDEYSWIFDQLYELEEYPRYQILYEYFTSSYSTTTL